MLRKTAAKKEDHEEESVMASAQAPSRRMIFISHANPEDNPAAAWFATQLTLLGYEVWCDIKNTHGGESDFWLKVQKVIENDAARFVFFLSNASCDFDKKKGIYKEVQTASNLGINNFIIPVRTEKLTRSLPILLGTDLYIQGENWAVGLQELVARLNKDGVPRRGVIDFDKVSTWWPALAVENIVRQDEEEELVSNILPITMFPETIYLLAVRSHGNLITGFESIRKVLPQTPACYAQGDHTVTFGMPVDFHELPADVTVETAYALSTHDFLSFGHEEAGISPDIAHNIVTYLIAQAWHSFMASKGLSGKTVARTNRTIWYVRDGLILNNRISLAEPSKRKVSLQLVGSVKHYRSEYLWHFGVLPTVDLRIHNGIILSPKAVISLPYNTAEGELPTPIDDKRVRRKLGWWNREWRQKLLAMLSWLSDEQSEITIPLGSQRLVLSATTESYPTDQSFREISDDKVINQAMESIVAKTNSS